MMRNIGMFLPLWSTYSTGDFSLSILGPYGKHSLGYTRITNPLRCPFIDLIFSLDLSLKPVIATFGIP